MIRLNGKQYVTPADAARILGVSPGRVFHFIADGRLEAVRIGRRSTLLGLSEVREFAKSRRRAPGPVPEA